MLAWRTASLSLPLPVGVVDTPSTQPLASCPYCTSGITLRPMLWQYFARSSTFLRDVASRCTLFVLLQLLLIVAFISLISTSVTGYVEGVVQGVICPCHALPSSPARRYSLLFLALVCFSTRPCFAVELEGFSNGCLASLISLRAKRLVNSLQRNVAPTSEGVLFCEKEDHLELNPTHSSLSITMFYLAYIPFFEL